MITLYRTKKSSRADEVQQTLEDLVLAHRIVEVEDREQLPADGAPPLLVEGDDVYPDEDIDAFLEELSTELKFDRQFSGDACYVDPDNPGRCV